jgi:hypothetical protein
VRKATLLGVASAVAVSFGSAASCTHGNYDGSYDAGDEGGSGAAVLASQLVPPDKTVQFTTSDGALTIQANPGTFSSPTMVTVKSAGEQTLGNGLIVPIYAVTADAMPNQPIALLFGGNGNNVLATSALAPTIQRGDGSYAPLPLTGSQNGMGGPSGMIYWGATSTLGTFSLGLFDGVIDGAFSDVALNACTAQCCAGNSGLSTTASINGSCFCGGSAPDLACILRSCRDLSAVASRCATLARSGAATVPCHPLVGGCPPNCGNPTCGHMGGQAPSVCCVMKTQMVTPCVGGGQIANRTCSGFAAYCASDSDCGAAHKCCIVGNESVCNAKCAEGQRLCVSDADCADADGGVGDGGAAPDAGARACMTNTFCPFKTCGPGPAGCN